MGKLECVRQAAYEQSENEGRPERSAEENWYAALQIVARHPLVDAPPVRLRANSFSEVLSEGTFRYCKDVLPRYLFERRWYSAEDTCSSLTSRVSLPGPRMSGARKSHDFETWLGCSAPLLMLQRFLHKSMTTRQRAIAKP
ncbi:DUF2934 domain-containing protein [Caballeronia sp. LZ001]|uniref:DUF2934 domain-containing protein n=1 Tax=Caballeronia sp. LZ001 TaxID=3038553 RepID=UPI0038D3796C